MVVLKVSPLSHARCSGGASSPSPARTKNRRFGMLSALRAHTKAAYKADSLWKTLRAHDQSGRAQTDVIDSGLKVAVLGVDHEPHALLDDRAAPSFFLARFPFMKLWFPSL